MSNDNVIILPVITTLDIPPERVLMQAVKDDLNSCFVIGYAKDGSEYFSSSTSDGANIIWMMERVKMKLLDISKDDL